MRLVRLSARFLLIVWIFKAAVVRYGWARAGAGRLSREDRDRLRGRVLADTLQRLGATFVKFGQILSTRADLLPPGIIESLGVLQDQVPPIAFEQIQAVLEGELDPQARARLVSIEPIPIAAASVAQVHRGELSSGESVALKVQRPRARAQIERDLVLMRLGARLLEWIPSIRLLSLRGAVERFGAALLAQLDFRREAENNLRFAANFASVEGVDVPRLFPELCTERILAMEFIEGVRATEPEKVGGDRKALAQRGLHAILKMVFQDAFVHADLHPGNILLTADDRVVLIDLGLVAEIRDDMRRPWNETFIAVSQHDGVRAAELFYGYAPEVGTADYACYERDVVQYFGTFHGKPLGEVEASVVIGGMMNVLRRHRVQVDPIFTVVNIAMLVAEGLGKQLDPELDLIGASAPHLMAAVATAPPGRGPRRSPPLAAA
ncbi:MAG: AarF/UbiB family protein [Myxococcales bacterium]|nr:AarF/UbiB family protein [Myxococcales bacterium]